MLEDVPLIPLLPNHHPGFKVVTHSGATMDVMENHEMFRLLSKQTSIRLSDYIPIFKSVHTSLDQVLLGSNRGDKLQVLETP
jgi:hypothetical protein